MRESLRRATANKMARSPLVSAATSLRRSRWPGVLLFSLLVLLLLSGTVSGAERIALLIGNTNYAEQVGGRLVNPIGDINRVEAALKHIGFLASDIDKLPNPDFANTHKAVNRYIRRLNGAGAGAIGFFYYSGHGAANPDTNVNYLIPVDVKSAEEDVLWDNSIALEGLIDDLRTRAPNATHIVVFDACRNELTVRRRGVKGPIRPKGFVPEKKRSGMLIAYATAAGETAPDDGFYAKVLAEELIKKNVEVISMFRTVQLEVQKATEQEPWVSSSALPELYLAGREDGPPMQKQGREATAPRFSLLTLAGTGENRSFGDGGRAISAGLAGPFGIAITPAGIVYVGEKQRRSIRSILPDRTMGTALNVDSSGQLSAGQRHGPNGLNDLIYVAGAFTNQVAVVDVTDGSTKILAGSGIEGFSGDNGPATEAQLSWPTGLAVTNEGVESLSEIFVADTHNNRIRLVKLDRTIRTIAGNGTRGSFGDHGPAREAQLNEPTFLAYRRDKMGRGLGELFIADTGNHKVRRVRLEDGEIVTIAGTGEAGFNGDGGPGMEAQLNRPLGLAFDSEGNLYIADSHNHRIRRIDTEGFITTVAGTGRYGHSGDHRDASAAELYFPTGVVWYQSSIYVSDFGHSKVRILSLEPNK